MIALARDIATQEHRTRREPWFSFQTSVCWAHFTPFILFLVFFLFLIRICFLVFHCCSTSACFITVAQQSLYSSPNSLIIFTASLLWVNSTASQLTYQTEEHRYIRGDQIHLNSASAGSMDADLLTYECGKFKTIFTHTGRNGRELAMESCKKPVVHDNSCTRSC